MVTPKLFESLIEELADRELLQVARQRLAQKHQAIEVDVDQI
jgi:antitoxin StbD